MMGDRPQVQRLPKAAEPVWKGGWGRERGADRRRSEPQQAPRADVAGSGRLLENGAPERGLAFY